MKFQVLHKASLLILLVVLLTTSCGEKTFNLDRYDNKKVIFVKKLVESPLLEYVIAVPNEWNINIKPASDENFSNSKLITTSAEDRNGFKKTVSIFKLPKDEKQNNLQDAIKSIRSGIMDKYSFYEASEIKETELFGSKTLYIDNELHNESGRAALAVDGVFESPDGNIYHVRLLAPPSETQKKTLAMLIQIVNTMKFKA
ncbi:MAG: hypothetical protein WBG46_03095 [Nonlabens sp.]